MELPLRLNQQQLAFFDTFGFLAFPGLMADRIGQITADFEALWASHGGGHHGKAHDGVARSCIAPFIDQSEALSALVDDPRVDAIATSLLGHDYNYMGSDGNYYVGDTAWHSDGWHPQIRHVKIAFYLDKVTRDTGCLRVIPGSHKIGDAYAESLQRDIWECQKNWGIEGRDIPSIALETEPGDLVVFNHNTKHASFGGSARRRMFTINLCQRYPDHKIQELRDYIAGGARFWVERAYGPAMLATATPARMVHMQQCLDNDDHLAALSAKARASMSEPARG